MKILHPMLVDTTRRNVEDWYQDKEEQADIHIKKADCDGGQADDRPGQIPASRPPHQIRVYILCDQPVIVGGIPPEELDGKTSSYQGARIENSWKLEIPVLAQERSWKGNEDNEQQEQNVEPEQDTVATLNVKEGVMVTNPVDAHNDETQDIGQVFWPEIQQVWIQFSSRVSMEYFRARYWQVKNEQGNRNGKDAVAECSNTLCAKSSRCWRSLALHCWLSVF